MTADKMQGEARQAERRRTDALSTLRTDGAGPVDVVVLDVSQTGVRIATSKELSVGQEITIGLAGAGVTRAYVAWGSGGEYGCAFDAPIGHDAAARAFSQGEVVRLGQPSAPIVQPEDVDLKELYGQHRFWALPWDALVMIVLMAGIAAAVLRATGHL